MATRKAVTVNHTLQLRCRSLIISDKSFQIRVKDLTISSMHALFQLQELIRRYKAVAPFMWNLLMVFVASPNCYRKEKEAREQQEDQDGDIEMENRDDLTWYPSNNPAELLAMSEEEPELDIPGAYGDDDEYGNYLGFSTAPVAVSLD